MHAEPHAQLSRRALFRRWAGIGVVSLPPIPDMTGTRFSVRVRRKKYAANLKTSSFCSSSVRYSKCFLLSAYDSLSSFIYGFNLLVSYCKRGHPVVLPYTCNH